VKWSLEVEAEAARTSGYLYLHTCQNYMMTCTHPCILKNNWIGLSSIWPNWLNKIHRCKLGKTTIVQEDPSILKYK
jgi:hypothetical protein